MVLCYGSPRKLVPAPIYHWVASDRLRNLPESQCPHLYIGIVVSTSQSYVLKYADACKTLSKMLATV